MVDLMADLETITAYNARAAEYADRFAQAEPDTIAMAFIANLSSGARVLDLGCGPGDMAAALRDAGCRVDAVDASQEMADIARQRHGIDVRIADFSAICDVAIYDGIWANFCLLHARKSDMPGHLGRLHRALRTGGRLHLGLKLGSGERRDRIGRFYAYYTDAEITGLLDQAGFAVINRVFGSSAGLDGTESPWIVLNALA